jgi:DNA polymerase III subunit delta'
MQPAIDFGINYFRRVLLNGRVGHAYLLSGLSGDAATETARRIAQVLLCPQQGCGNCGVCQTIMDGNCSDLHILQTPADKRVIKIDDIRNTVIREASLKTYASKRKVFLIIDADSMNDAAANCFLKTLEEPPGDSVMLLMSNRPESIPQTITSRCFRLRLATGVSEQSERIDADEKSEAVRLLAGTLPEGALDLADRFSKLCEAEALDQRRQLALELLDSVMLECRNGLMGKGPFAELDEEVLLDSVNLASNAQRSIDSNAGLDMVIDDFVTKFSLNSSGIIV